MLAPIIRMEGLNLDIANLPKVPTDARPDAGCP
jgi:hypothetical protein